MKLTFSPECEVSAYLGFLEGSCSGGFVVHIKTDIDSEGADYKVSSVNEDFLWVWKFEEGLNDTDDYEDRARDAIPWDCIEEIYVH